MDNLIQLTLVTKWMTALVVPAMAVLIAILGLKFRDKIARKNSYRDDIKLLLEAVNIDESVSQPLREICIVKAFEHAFETNFSYAVLEFLLSLNNPEQAIEEYKRNKNILYFDKNNNTFIKQTPFYTSTIAGSFAFFVSKYNTSIQMWFMFIVGLFVYLAGGLLFPETVNNLSVNLSILELVALALSIFGISLGFFIMLVTFWTAMGFLNIEDRLTVIPFENRHRESY